MEKLRYIGSVKDGVINMPKKVRKDIINAFDGRQFVATYERKKKKRSIAQNAYYWGVVIDRAIVGFKEVSPDILINPETVHQFFKERFLPMVVGELQPIVNKQTGEIVVMPYTTTKLSPSEFSDYIHFIDQFCMNFLDVKELDPMPVEEWPPVEFVDVDKGR
jgi:hypothetical protein